MRLKFGSPLAAGYQHPERREGEDVLQGVQLTVWPGIEYHFLGGIAYSHLALTHW